MSLIFQFLNQGTGNAEGAALGGLTIAILS